MSVEYRNHFWNIQAPWKPYRGIGDEMLAMLDCRFGDGESSCQRDSEPLGEVLVTAQCVYFIQFSFQTDITTKSKTLQVLTQHNYYFLWLHAMQMNVC